MKFVHIKLPQEYDSIKQFQNQDKIYVNDNYKYPNEETETIYHQLKNQ